MMIAVANSKIGIAIFIQFSCSQHSQLNPRTFYASSGLIMASTLRPITVNSSQQVT